MVLAAGLGTRLKPYTDLIPKPLVPVLGVPCIDYSLLQLPAVGVKEVVVNVHAHASAMIEHLQKSSTRDALKIQISDETAMLLGSAGGYRQALSFLESNPGQSEPFFALNADVISSIDLRALAIRHQQLRQKQGVVMTLCLADGEMLQTQEGAYTEILFDEQTGLVTGTGSKKSKVPFYIGTAVFETECFRHLKAGSPAEFVPEVLLPMIAAGKVGFFKVDQLWLDVGSPVLWWKSHFELQNARLHGKIPGIWNRAIAERIDSLRLSESSGWVDYDLSSPVLDQHTGKCIRFRGVCTNV
jgi:NDP-sugar pyrophosphorylase family protein